MRGRHFVRSPLLGTDLEVQVVGLRARRARAVADAVFDEVARLEQVCSAFRADSALERWKRGAPVGPDDDLAVVLRLVLDHQRRSGGALNPLTGALRREWAEAARRGEPPDPDRLAALAAAIREPRYRCTDDGRPEPTGDCSDLDLHAVGKGWIVDRAVAAARDALGDATLIVNASGDLRHVGPTPVVVRVEDPIRHDDTAPPLTSVVVTDVGVATSGRAHQGFSVADRWHSHVLDPRTGIPVDDVASVTVVAPDAATADALATVLGVEPPARAAGLADAAGVAWLTVLRDGTVHANAAWRALPTGDATRA